MLKKSALIICLFILKSSFTHFNDAFANVDQKCGVIQDQRFWTSYCLYSDPNSKNQDLLYYFHGYGGNETSWGNNYFYPAIYNQWANHAPKVLTISYGSSWLLAEKTPSNLSGMYDHFVQFVIPTLEKQLKIKPEHRLLFGISMGGFNASQLYLKSPELFSKVALGCPEINTLNPNASYIEISNYVLRTNSYIYYVQKNLELMNYFFPDSASWANANPIELAKKKINPNYPPLNISCGDLDEVGFFEGANIFAEVAKSKGASVEWNLLHGYHCTVDGKNIAQFFTFPESSLPSPN